jgi:hypothetical protein
MKHWAAILVIVVLPALAIGCRNECQELCEGLQADFENFGIETDCASDLWTAPDTCAECLEVVDSLRVAPADPDGLCEEYF